jgi:hypothetical protein
MAKTRKRSGRGKSSQRKRSSFSFFQRIWSPFEHALMIGEDTSQELGNTSGKIVKESIGVVRRIGASIANHTNQAVRNITRRGRGRKSNL